MTEIYEFSPKMGSAIRFGNHHNISNLIQIQPHEKNKWGKKREKKINNIKL